jgi:Flp pilus assembly pilin Flp
MKQVINAIWKEDSGQEMVEYTLLLAFFALTGLAVLSNLRTEVVTVWQAIAAGYTAAAS